MARIPNKVIGEYIVPGWLPSWMYTQIEMGADLERVLVELEEARVFIKELVEDCNTIFPNPKMRRRAHAILKKDA